MRFSKFVLAAFLATLGTRTAMAAPTPEEAAQLGKTLTPFGAIKAGNADGTIPEWAGGLCKPPANYKPKRGAAGGAPYVDPFPEDKPLFKITAADVEKYGDKIDEGTKELFKRYPQSFYLNVYQTRRTACYPDWAYENTIKRVMNPKIVTPENPSLEGAHAQVPFPIPKTGLEVMWNQNVKFETTHMAFDIDQWMVDSAGNKVHTSINRIENQNLYWNNDLKAVPEGQPYWALISFYPYPASLVGRADMRHQYLRKDKYGAPAWSYTPGQRRVRLAPEFSYDGVSTTSGGILLYDEINGFDGNLDRFDFKLIGRKEMYVPYNGYKYNSAPVKDILGPKHINPEYMRWELHRVWMVEATLKPGERHTQKRKVFYVDEDSWTIQLYAGYDHAGKIHHLSHLLGFQLYDRPEYRTAINQIYDFSKSAYIATNKGEGETESLARGLEGNFRVPAFRKNYFTPDSMAGMGVR